MAARRLARVAFVLACVVALPGCRGLTKGGGGTQSCSCGGTGCSCSHCMGSASRCPCRAADAYGGGEGVGNPK